jgi:tetratricopeptide (TPR) repeat protein
MAKRRLNKKVALVGSAIFIVVALGAILAILYLSRDPEKFIAEGDAAWQAKDYARAEHSYHKARNLAKTDSLRKEIFFKLIDLYIETDEWRFVRGCWEEIINLDPKDIKARYARLKYFYIMADSGAQRVWQDVRQQASELTEIVEQANLLTENTDKWETAGLREKGAVGQPMGQYLYLLKGRAAIEMAKLGVVPDTEALFAQGVADLEKVRKFDPANVDAHWYLAQAAITKGDIFAGRGNFEERDKAIEQAKALTEQAVKAADADPRAHMNFLLVKLLVTQKGGKGEIDALEQEYLSLAERFSSDAEVFARLSRFYSDRRVGPKNLDKAIGAIEQAIKLDSDNVTYAINEAYLRYRKFSYYGQKDELSKAIERAKHALTLPDAQEQSGPRNWANRLNRVSLYLFLANCYIEQVLEPCEKRTEAQTAVWVKDAEEAVHGIEQILGSGEDPQVIKWRGLLDLAKGDKNAGIRKLYAAYEQFKAASAEKAFERIDSLLAYRLAKIFEDTEEIGAANEFFAVALRLSDRNLPDRIDEKKPEAFLDYAEILLKLKVYNEALHLVNFFESQYWSNERSRILRVKAYIGAKQFDDAAEELANRPDANSLGTVKLNLELVQAKIHQTLIAIAQKQMQERPGIFVQPVKVPGEATAEPEASMEVMRSELKSYRQREAALVRKLLSVEPNSVEAGSVITVCRNYIEGGRKSEAGDMVNQFLARFPDSTAILVYKQMLSEPDPANVSEQRRREIEVQVLSSIANPLRRAVELGVFYRRNNEQQKAVEQLKAAFEMGASPGRISDSATREQVNIASQHLFDVALSMKDWQLAGQIAERARRDNLDECEGRVFAARLAVAKGEFKDALAKTDECLKQKPVFSRAYMLRSNINNALGDEHASMEDIKKAASLNPLDGAIARGLAVALYRRDQKLGSNVSPNQIVETRGALDRAVALNSGDLQLLSFYAEYISSTEPLRALAICQDLQRAAPSVGNAVRLGKLAARVARELPDPVRKNALFAVADSSFEEARKINPQDKEMLYCYAEYLRSRGQDDKAKNLLEESRDEKLLWNYYIQSGQYDDARKVLEQMYQGGTKDSAVLKGLLLIGEKTADIEAIKKYSEELVSLEENAENRLIQIQSFLRVGLLKEVEFKVQSIKEKYPNEPRIQLLEALLVMRQGQLQKALDLANRYIQNNQNNAVAWRIRGEINLYMANYDPAISDLKASKTLSDDPLTRLSLAKAYLQMKRFDDVITELKNTIDAPTAPVEARRLLEQVYTQLGRKDALKAFYDQTLAKFPDSVLWHNRAAAFAITTGEFDKAEQLYEKVYRAKRQAEGLPNAKDGIKDVQYAAAFDGYLRALVSGAGDRNAANWNPRKLDKVFVESKHYIDSAFAPMAYLRMAEARLKLGDKITAREYCRRAVDKASSNESLAADVLLRMYLMLGSGEVSKYCEQKLQTDPDSVPANFTMFNLAKIDGQYDKAIRYIDKCIQTAKEGDPRIVEYVAKKAEVLTLAYERTFDNNYLRRAVADYESLLAKMPNNTNVLNNLAYMLAESVTDDSSLVPRDSSDEGRRTKDVLEDALQYAKRAFDISPNDPSFMDTYGYVLYKNGKVSQAAELLAAALQRYEQDTTSVPSEVYEHLGMIKEKLGAKTEALDAYKRAMEVGADGLSQKRREQINDAVKRLSQ